MTDTNKKSAFDRKVDDCREHNKSDLIDNAAWDHALYLFKNLLEVAAEKGEDIRLVSGTLNNKFYSALKTELDACIEAKVDIELMILDGDANTENNVFACGINEYAKGAVLKAPEGLETKGAHMLLIGDDAKRFRLETDHDQTKAVASFDNPSMGETLNVIYKDIKDRLQESINTPASV